MKTGLDNYSSKENYASVVVNGFNQKVVHAKCPESSGLW